MNKKNLNNEKNNIKNSFIIFKKFLLSYFDQQILFFLYEPIIGIKNLNIYFLLYFYFKSFTGYSSIIFLKDFLESFNLKLKDFLNGLFILEKIKLIEIFLNSNNKNNIYFLFEPIKIKKFLEKNNFLYNLFLYKIGEYRLKKILFFLQFQEENFNLKFKKIYLKNNNFFKKIDFKNYNNNEKKIDIENLFSKFKNINFGIEKEKIKKMVLVYYKMYGIDFKNMLILMKKSFNFNKKFSLNIFEKNILIFINKFINNYYFNNNNFKIKNEFKKKNIDYYKKNGFNNNDIEVIMQCKKIYPGNYLFGIKNLKNGFIDKFELYNIKYLIKNSILNNEVINILIHYILVIENKIKIETNHLNNIVHDWVKNKICTAEDAMKYVRNFIKNKNKFKTLINNKRIFREKIPKCFGKINDEKVSIIIQKKMKQKLNILSKINIKKGKL